MCTLKKFYCRCRHNDIGLLVPHPHCSANWSQMALAGYGYRRTYDMTAAYGARSFDMERRAERTRLEQVWTAHE